MNYKILIVTLAIFSNLAPVYASKDLSCGGDFRYTGGQPQGQKHTDVRRAGVVLCKDYGKDKKHQNDRYAILLGHDRHLKLWNFQAGGVENQHNYTTETASAELCEETGGLLKYTGGDIYKLPYICSRHKQLFFLFNSADKNIGVRALNKSCQAAVANIKLPSCYREVDQVTDVSVVEFLRVAKLIKTKQLPQKGNYDLYDRNGNKLRISGGYMRTMADRYDQICVIFNQTFGVNIFH